MTTEEKEAIISDALSTRFGRKLLAMSLVCPGWKRMSKLEIWYLGYMHKMTKFFRKIIGFVCFWN